MHICGYMWEAFQLKPSKSPSTIMWPRETEFNWLQLALHLGNMDTVQRSELLNPFTTVKCTHLIYVDPSTSVYLSICDICFLLGISCEIDSMIFYMHGNEWKWWKRYTHAPGCPSVNYYELHSMQHQSLNLPIPNAPKFNSPRIFDSVGWCGLQFGLQSRNYLTGQCDNIYPLVRVI